MILLALLLSTAGCAPAAAPGGPLGDQLRAALARRGVRGPTAGCAAVEVHVEASGAGIALRQPGAPGQVVPDLETAALLVETWVRADLIDPLLAARRGPALPPPPPAAPAGPPARPMHFTAGLTGGAAADRSQWTGVEGQGCITLGPTCTGLTARILFDGGLTGDSHDERVWRLGFSLLASAEIDPGPVRAALGIGMTTVRVDSKDSKDDDVRGAPLLEGRVARAIVLGDGAAVDLGLAGDLALWPRRGRRSTEDADFPGMPRWWALASVGVRWSAW